MYLHVGKSGKGSSRQINAQNVPHQRKIASAIQITNLTSQSERILVAAGSIAEMPADIRRAAKAGGQGVELVEEGAPVPLQCCPHQGQDWEQSGGVELGQMWMPPRLPVQASECLRGRTPGVAWPA